MGFMKTPSIPSAPTPAPPVQKEEVMQETIDDYNARVRKRKTLLSTVLHDQDSPASGQVQAKNPGVNTTPDVPVPGALRKTLG